MMACTVCLVSCVHGVMMLCNSHVPLCSDVPTLRASPGLDSAGFVFLQAPALSGRLTLSNLLPPGRGQCDASACCS